MKHRTKAQPVSICIPSCDRPEYLVEAIESCFEQSYRPLEIVVGDDSSDDLSHMAVRRVCAPSGIQIRYLRNIPRLGQACNVNSLFAAATSPRVILLHDDDLLVPGAVDLLTNTLDSHDNVVAAFGKFYIVDESGQILEDASTRYNRDYFRTSSSAGAQASAIVSGLRQQFPGAGYLVDRGLACAVGYREANVVDEFGDMDFGVRLGIAAEPARFFFIDEFIYKYRQTSVSIARSRNIADRNKYRLYEAMSQLPLPEKYQNYRLEMLRRLSPYCLQSFALSRNRTKAFRLYFSREYGLSRFSLRAWYQFLGILFPNIILWREGRRHHCRANTRRSVNGAIKNV